MVVIWLNVVCLGFIWCEEGNSPNRPNLPNSPEQAANMLLTLCHMETYLLHHLIDALKQKFVQEGGYRESLFAQRMEYRRKYKG